nr:MAG TPA: hypothetical protein [Caudoviricetes sp.]
MSKKVEQVGGTSSGTSRTCSTPAPSQKRNNLDLFRYLFQTCSTAQSRINTRVEGWVEQVEQLFPIHY